MQQSLESLLARLITIVKTRNAHTGDVFYDTMFAAYYELMRDDPNYRYVRNIITRALA